MAVNEQAVIKSFFIVDAKTVTMSDEKKKAMLAEILLKVKPKTA